MAIHMTMDLPVSRADIEAVSNAMGVRDDVPDGLILHVAFDLPEGGIRIVDVWESQKHFESFRDSRLNPTLGKVLPERGIEMDGPPPDPQYSEVYDLVHG
ncbi:MAG: hypothetical protein QOC86_2842 [Gaiellales bacterium]|nr:hypothetical protein [Gaiellales bacterium]